MQRRDSLGSTTKIPRLSKGSTRKFRTRRSQTSFSSASDAFAEDESTKGQPDLSVIEMRLRSEKNLDGNQGRSAEAEPASETPVDPFDEGERTLIRPDFEPDGVLEREEVERTEETSERSEVEPREEVLYRGMSKSETKSYKWRREPSHLTSAHSSLAKQSNNAMMSSMSPGKEQTFSKAKKSWKSLYDERMASLPTVGLTSSDDYPEITHPDVNFTPCPRNEKSRKASSVSPTRPMSDGITMGASSTFDRLMTSMHKQKDGASSSTRLPPQLTSSSLGLTPPLGAAGDISDMFAGVMNGLDELRRDMTKRIDQVDERAHHGRENLKDELTHVKSQARFDQARLIRDTDQCLAESLAQANKESEEREARMTREIERLLNDHDNTYAQTMTGLERRLDAKSDLMMRKLDAILNGNSWQEHSNSRERSRHANVGDGTGNSARAQQGSRTNYEHRNKERPRAAPQRPGWTNPVPPEADATPETRLPTVPQVSSVPDLTTVSQDTTMYASMFEPLNRSLETFITKLSKSTERGERSRRTLKKPKSYKDESDGCIDTWIEVMKLHFEEENLSKKQECSALTSNLEGTALNCVMAKRANERDSARKIFDILLNRFGSGVQGHQAMVKFEKRRQRDEESIDKFLDDLELLRRRSNPDERISERNLAIASKFMDGVRSEELKTMLATHFTLSLDQVPTPDDLRMKSREYLLIKPRAQNRYSNYGNYSGTNTGANSSWYKPRDDMDKRRSCANCGSMDHHVSACSAYKQNMKAIGYFLEDADATDEDHEEYVRGLIMKYGPRCFFCNLEGHFKSDCAQFWDAVADVKHPRHEEALSGVKASRARLMNEAESRRKETTPSTFTTKKVKTWPEGVASNLETESSSPLKVDYGLAARTALQNVKQDLATKEVEQWVRSELESTDLRESLNVLSKTTRAEDEKEPKKQGLKLNVISGKTFGMTKAGTKIMSIISVAGHQVVKNLSEPSEITLVHLDIYADYLKEKDPKLDSRAVRALLTTGGPRLMKVDGHYIDVHGPYPILMNVDGINIYTKAHITDANDQVGRIYIGQEELKVRRIGHNAMLEQDAVHIGCEADLAAHVLDVQGRQLSVKGLLDTGAVVSVMPIKTWTDMGFERSDLIPTNIRLAAANQGAIYVAGRTPIISLQLGGRHLWMSFLVVENLDESDQFILGRDFVRNFDVTIDLNDGLIRIKDPERKYEKRPLNKILINQAKVPIFLDRKVRLKPNQAVVATFRMRNLNELSNDRQVCLVPNPNSKSSAILGRSFSLTQSGLCVSVLLNTEATTVTIQRGKKLGYALPLNTDFLSVENLKKFDVTKCPLHANQECIMKRVIELKSSRKLFSMKSETDDGLSSCSNFPERPTEAELAANRPVLPEIEHLKGKISDKELDSLRAVLNRNADVFSKHKADIGCCNFVEHEIEIEEGSVPHREGARRMTPNKSEACRKEIEMLMEYDMIEPSKSPWACGVVMAKNERGTRDKNDGNEMVDNCDLPLDLELTERVEVDDETLPYAEEDWDCPEQTEIDKGIQPDFPLTMETRQSKRGKNQKKYNPYGEDFVVDRIVVSDVIDSLVGLDEVAILKEIDLVNDMDQDWIDDRSEPEVEFEPEAEQTHEQELTNLRVLEWLHDLPTDPKETILTIQDVDRDGVRYISHDNTESNWVAPDGPLRVPQSNLGLLDFGRSTGTSMDIFVRGVGVGLTHTENLIIKKLKSARETGELETEGENAKKPPFGRIFESYFDLPNHYSNNIVITDSDFILTERTCAIAITADVSLKTALAADFKREYKNIEFLWKQRPGVGGMIALPPVASQIPGKYLCFLVTKATDRQHVNPESLVLALTRLRDFLVERGATSLSLPVYDPNRGKLHPRELYALVHVIFSETDIEVYLHKKYYLSIC